MSPCDVIQLRIDRIESYGVYGTHEGTTVLIQVPEITWTLISHPREAVAIGEVVSVLVLKVVESDDMAIGSIRRLDRAGNPFLKLARSALPAVYQGHVRSTCAGKAFVVLSNGAYAYTPFDESRPLSPGQEVMVEILDVDATKGKATIRLVAR